MRLIIVVFLTFALQKSFAQTTVYTFNSSSVFTEAEIKKAFESVSQSLPSSEILVPNIFHTTTKKDTIVNFIEFAIRKRVAGEQPIFKFTYKQDSTFLLLNNRLPAFKLKELGGKEVSLSQLIGKPTLINFWAIYCGPCIAEMPELSKLKEKYKDKMNFISITENNGTNDHLADFLKDKNFNFPVLENGQLYKKELKLRALPRNLFLDKDGVLRYIFVNYPVNANSIPLDLNDKGNYFTKIIEELIK
ncbi:Thiol-disulfide isomerase or thioredoxin [Pedobacter sp. ok626]|uniref:TlpA disulfide reductase family protein n=1 Tax=Pedobacter sp. ok626 TaxID=1761882 RepID=UPI000882C379|nr:TlpA disulfide reductase family protein [Pedobacter sp. ok626]SDL56202.1 Thiol-disulfide isomerase or thioredoxin [Pedobacter sp. ok626]